MSEIQNNTSLLKTRYPRENVFPASWTKEDWEKDWVENLARNQEATNQLLNDIDTLSYDLSVLPRDVVISAMLESTLKGMLVTAANRTLEKLSTWFKLPETIKNMLHIFGYIGLFAKMTYDAQAPLISSSVHFVSQFVMTKLGLSPRKARQISSIAAITSITALDLYHHPASDNVAHLITTVGGATLGVLGTDLLFDVAENCIAYGYEKYNREQTQPRLNATNLARKEAIQLLGYNPEDRPTMQTRAMT